MPTSVGTENPPGKISRWGVEVWGRCEKNREVV